MGVSDWGATELGLLVFNLTALGIIIWAIRLKIISKLAEVEERHNRSTEKRKGHNLQKDQESKPLNEEG